MKLQLLALLLFTAPSVFAKENDSIQQQRFEIGLRAGTTFTAPPSASINTYEPKVIDGKPKYNKFTGAFSIWYNFKKVTVGVSAGLMALSFIVDPDGPPVDGTSTQILAPLVPFQLYASAKHKWGHNELYAGISGGIILPYKTYTIGGWAPPRYSTGNGMIMGLHGGDTYYFTKHIGLNAELNLNYILLAVEEYTVTSFNAPLTIGVKYKL